MRKRNSYTMVLSVLLAFFSTMSATAQLDFRDNRIQRAINDVFHSYDNIDSIVVGFDNNVPSGLSIFERSEDNTTRAISKKPIYYILSFEGDQYMLGKKLPAISRLIYSKRHIKRIRKAAQHDSFVWILTNEVSKFRSLQRGVKGLHAEFKTEKLEELINVLNDNYYDSIVPTGDSVLIFQAVVEKDGTLASELELLSGEKDAFYHYFMKTYDYYVSQVLTKSFYKARLYRPYLKSVQRRGLIDIFVQLNKDRTFSISGTGEARVFQLKNFTDDPKNPIFY